MGQHGVCDPVCAELPAQWPRCAWCGACVGFVMGPVCMESGRTCEGVIVGRSPLVPCTLDSSTHSEMQLFLQAPLHCFLCEVSLLLPPPIHT